MTSAITQPNRLDILPLELVDRILRSLDFESVGPFLEAFPDYKRHVLIISHERANYEYFNIPGVEKVSRLPASLKAQGAERILLILFNMTRACYSNTDETYANLRTACRNEMFAKLVHFSPDRLFIHSSVPHKRPDPVYNEMNVVLINHGFKFREDCFELPLHNWQRLGSQINQEEKVYYFPPCEAVLHLKLLYLTGSTYENITIDGARQVVIDFTQDNPGLRGHLSNIKLIGVEEVHIKYQGQVPEFHNVSYERGDVDLLERPRNTTVEYQTIFSLTDFATQTFNHTHLPSTGKDDDISGTDLSWTRKFECIRLSGGPIDLLVDSLEKDSLKCLEIVRTSDTPQHIEEITAPSLTSFKYTTTQRNTAAPKLNTPALKHLALITHASGFSFSRCLGGITDRSLLESLIIDVEKDKTVHEIDNSFMISVAPSIRKLVLKGMYLPWVGDYSLIFRQLNQLTLSLVRSHQSIDSTVSRRGLKGYSSDTLRIRSLARSRCLYYLSVRQSPKSSSKWANVDLLGKLRAYHLTGFDGEVTAGSSDDRRCTLRGNAIKAPERCEYWWRGPSSKSWTDLSHVNVHEGNGFFGTFLVPLEGPEYITKPSDKVWLWSR